MLKTITRFIGEGVSSTGVATPEEAVEAERKHRRLAALQNIALTKQVGSASSAFSTHTISMYELVMQFDAIKACLDASDDQFVRENAAFLKKHVPQVFES